MRHVCFGFKADRFAPGWGAFPMAALRWPGLAPAGTVPLLISDAVAGGKRPGRMNSTLQGGKCRPLITRISGPLWRADWRVRQAEKGLRMFEEAQPTSLRRPRLTGPEGGHPRRGRDSGARFFAFFLVVQQERRSPAGARPGQRHAKHRGAPLKRQSIGAISPQDNLS